jgi:hypothetical protein
MADFDTGLVARGHAAADLMALFAEHAVDAALARGVSLEEITAVVDERPAPGRRSQRSLASEDATVLPDDDEVPHGTMPEAAARLEGMTFGALRQSIAVQMVQATAALMIANAQRAVARGAKDRAVSMGLDPSRAPIGQLLTREESRSLYMRGLDETPTLL